MNRKIALLLPDLRGGGAEKVAVNLANDFCVRGYSVDFLLVRKEGVFLDELDSRITVVDLHGRRMRHAFWPLVQYLRHHQPPVLLAFMWPLTVLAISARIAARVATRVIVSEHTTWSDAEIVKRSTATRWMSRFTMHLLFPRADGIIAVSRGSADDLARFAGIDRRLITVVYNPVVGKLSRDFIETPEPLAWSIGEHYRVLAVGSLKPVKDYPTLLTAFEKVLRQCDARLLILGEGERRTELESLIRRLGLDNRVYMPGFAKDPMPYYRQANLFVLSSKLEGLSNVIIEALSVGTPVVSTDCPCGPREILCDGKYGCLVPVGDPDALAVAMLQALSEEPDRESLRARAKEFSVDKIAQEYLEVLFPKEC